MTIEAIRYSLIGEIAHQVIMRGSLRNQNGIDRSKNVCDVYVMEMELAAYLARDIFNNCKTECIHKTDRPEVIFNKHTKAPISGIDRKKASCIRKNFNEYKDLNIKDLMNEPIWLRCNTNGKYVKAYIDLIK